MSINTKNVTLSLPRAIISMAKHIAIDKGTSLSGLVSQVLSEEINRANRYNSARQQALYSLKTPFNLGTKGKKLPLRENLHAR